MSDSPSYALSQPFDLKIDVQVPMSDGVSLSTDIYLPKSGGPFPALLVRTIYDNQNSSLIDAAEKFMARGYAVVTQDCRGRFDSDGEWQPYVNEAQDGHDTQEWIGSQDWCDGNIGTFGTSYVGFTQSLTAPLRSKYLKALVPHGVPAGQLWSLLRGRRAPASRSDKLHQYGRTDDAKRQQKRHELGRVLPEASPRVRHGRYS